MQINVKTLTGETISIDCTDDTIIEETLKNLNLTFIGNCQKVFYF